MQRFISRCKNPLIEDEPDISFQSRLAAISSNKKDEKTKGFADALVHFLSD